MSQILDANGRPFAAASNLAKPGHTPFRPPFHRGRLAPTEPHALPQSPVRGWEAESARAARNQSTMGFIGDLTDIAQFMLNDSALYSPLMRRIDGLTRSPVMLTPSTRGDRQLNKRVCRTLEALWHRIFPLQEMEHFLRWWHMIDTSFGSLRWGWSFEEECMVPTLKSLNPRYATFDIAWDIWRFPTWDDPATDVVSPGDGRWVTLTSWQYGQWAGAASRLLDDWILKQYSNRDWASWSDFSANQILVAEVPAGGADDDEAKQNFIQDVEEGRGQRVIGVYKSSEPGDSYGVHALDMSNEGWMQMKERVNLTDRKYLMYFLGGNLSEITEKGSFAAAQEHSAAEQEEVMRDARVVAQVLRQQVLVPFVVENGWPAEACPDFMFKVAVAEEQEKRSQGYLNFAEFLGKLPDGYVIENLSEIASEFGFRLKQKSPVLGAPPEKLTGIAPSTTSSPKQAPRKPTEKSSRVGR